MDRQIVYPGAIPQDTDFLGAQKNIMIALGYIMQGVFGKTPAAIGFTCNPTSPASLSVNVDPGALTNYTVIDNLNFGSLGSDTTDPLLKTGIQWSETSFTLSAPSTAGQSQIFLISAEFTEAYAGSEVLAYVNAANPSDPWSGPSNDGASQYTQIVQGVTLTLTAGTPSTSPVAPAVPSGQIGLWLVTVANGQTTITSGNIALYPSAPFRNFPLQTLRPGVSSMLKLTPTTSGNWVVPNGVTIARVRLWGGGGGGGNGTGSYPGSGGGGGGYIEAYVPVVPGTSIPVTVGAGGAAETVGGDSDFGGVLHATGGLAGSDGSATLPVGGAGGVGSIEAELSANQALLMTGGEGQSGFLFSNSGTLQYSGQGGHGASGGGAGRCAVAAIGVASNGVAGAVAGGGGSGGCGAGSTGGPGGDGRAVIEW